MALKYLGTHVAGSSALSPQNFFLFNAARESQVSDAYLHSLFIHYKNIVRFDVAMDYLFLVHEVYSQQDLAHDHANISFLEIRILL